ncbi:MAG: hypothetical protein GXO86_10045 [Chlorobi bacterium]|nr:hypothetical protein [Chlorobiota bacterium]
MNKKFTYRVFSLFSLLAISVITYGQSMTGLTFSTYSGVSSAIVNPALMTGSKVFVDINVVGGSSFLENDMVFFPAGEKILRQVFSRDSINLNNGDYKYHRNYTYFNNTNDKYGYIDLRLLGPSIMVQAGKHAFALSTSFRSVHAGNNIPYEVPVLIYEGADYEGYFGKNYHEKNYSFVSMTWTELGLSYAYDFYERYDNRFTFGATVKALFGHEGGYLSIKDLDFTVIDEKTVQFNNANTELGIALPLDYETNSFNTKPFTKGYGVGLDLGFVFTKKSSTFNFGSGRKLCEKPYSDYIYKIGVSVLDLGFMNFSKNTEKHVFDNVGVYWEDYDTTHYDGIRRTIQSYSQAFYGDPNASYASDRMRILLPTVISLQFDYHLNKNFYLGALWNQPVKFQLNQLYQPAQVAIIPRYENRFLGVSVPVSVFNYRQPRIGVALRIYTFTVGTEKLGSWLGVSDFTGMDFYFSFKINLQKGICGSYLKGACFNSDW